MNTTTKMMIEHHEYLMDKARGLYNKAASDCYNLAFRWKNQHLYLDTISSGDYVARMTSIHCRLRQYRAAVADMKGQIEELKRQGELEGEEVTCSTI